MRQLSLQARLLIAVAVIVVLQVAVGFVVLETTRSRLHAQVDGRLEVIASAGPDDRGGLGQRPPGGPPPDGPEPSATNSLGGSGLQSANTRTDIFFGEFEGEELVTLSPSWTDGGVELVPPQLSRAAAAAISGQSNGTTLHSSGEVAYRAIVTNAGGQLSVTALPNTGIDETMSLLTTVTTASLCALAVALALLAWWVIRLGLGPIKRMTNSAQAVAAGDLSERIDVDHPRTEAGQLGTALNVMMQRIETSFAEQTTSESRLRQFLADASHELRTPVTTIRGYAELYRSGGLDEPAALADAMARTEDESHRMSRLVGDMLDLAQLDHEPGLIAEPIDLASLVNDVVADAQVRHPDRALRVDTPAAPALVSGDRDLLLQLATNVIDNAVLHTASVAEVAVSVMTSEHTAILEVRDSGPGMTPEVASRITERFYRADPSRSRQNGGSGLGMAIVDSIVRAHDGEMSVISGPETGTTVKVAIASWNPAAGDSQRTHS